MQEIPISVHPSGQSGEQIQQPTLWNPGAHLGYHSNPFYSHPYGLSLSHYSFFHKTYPTPLPYALGFRQKRPLSVKFSGQVVAHTQHSQLV